MKYRIIGIAGQARSGKDTAADIIIDAMPHYNKISFADPLKKMLSVGLRLTESQLYGSKKEIIDVRYGKTPRTLMQLLGTEFGRNMICQDIWVNAVKDHISCKDNIDNCYIIPDLRYESEASMVRNMGGIVLHIKGNDTIKSDHSSESGIYVDSSDVVIMNTGTLESYYSIVNEIIKEIL